MKTGNDIQNKSQCQRGFSLLEVLIALSILSLVSVVIWQSISFSMSMKTKTNEFQIARKSATDLRILKPFIMSALPANALGREKASPLKISDNEINLITAEIHSGSWNQLSELRVWATESEKCEGKLALTLFWRPLQPEQGIVEDWDLGRILVDCADEVKISALDYDTDTEKWLRFEVWDEDDLPERVEIRVVIDSDTFVVASHLVFASGHI